MNLSEDRKGALFVVIRDSAQSIPQLIARADRIVDEVATDDPEDPDNLSPRLAKQALHHVVRGRTLLDLGVRLSTLLSDVPPKEPITLT